MNSSSTTAASEAAITPEILRDHGITPEEYDKILKSLGRTPTLTELGIYSVMWSEHCSYKSSPRAPEAPAHAQPSAWCRGRARTPASSTSATAGPAPSRSSRTTIPAYIEPFQGAATGVGGILRDIFTMGARPLAVMDSLRFGPHQ